MTITQPPQALAFLLCPLIVEQFSPPKATVRCVKSNNSPATKKKKGGGSPSNPWNL